MQAIELRLAGASYRQIGAQLGVSYQTAFNYVVTMMRRYMAEPTEQLRQLEVARLDTLLLGVWKRASAGDHEAITDALRIMERRAKLLGLDAPEKVEITDLLRREAEKYGLSPDDVIAAAEDIVRGR